MQRDLCLLSSNIAGLSNRRPFSGRPEGSRGLALSMMSVFEVVSASSASVTGAPCSAWRITRANSIRLASLGLTMMAGGSWESGQTGAHSNGLIASASRHAGAIVGRYRVTVSWVGGISGSAATMT
jgi:hypothetical protein